MGNVARTKENLKKCECMSCPSYTLTCKVKEIPHDMMVVLKGELETTEHFEGMFCAFGKSECIEQDKGCNCGSCAVAKENDLHSGAYCLKGNA